jgi:hypothetical protein
MTVLETSSVETSKDVNGLGKGAGGKKRPLAFSFR